MWKSRYAPVLLVLAATACTVGPDYQVPAAKLEASFKNAGFTEPPPEGSWWKLFGDPKLDDLMARAEAENPGVRAALARYDRSRAAIGLAAADAYPAVTADALAERSKDSGNTNFSSGIFEDYRAALNLSWEIDLWGRVRRQIGAAVAEQEAASFEYQGALLSLRGELARAYLSLRFADAEIALLENTEGIRAEARRLMKSRFDKGVSSEIDYQRAITEHESVKAELAQTRARRAKFENAIAALTGRSAAGFRLERSSHRPRVPQAVATVPSDLLRRRPDIAAAERRLAAASERIGLAIASYLPRVTLGGEAGFRSLTTSNLFNSGSKLWSLGPDLAVPLFQGGRLSSEKEQAEAAYREALENYREVLLQAVRETEDALADHRYLAKASSARARGARSADRAADLSRDRYDGGISDYFEVVDADRTLLAEQRARLEAELAQALAATRLVQALGGGWSR